MLRFDTGSLYEPATEGAPGGVNPTFDPVAFQAQILATMNTTLGAFATRFQADLAKRIPVAPVVEAPVVPVVDDPTKPPADPVMAANLRDRDRQIKALSDQFTAMKLESDATRKSADKKELDATVRTQLNKFRFADDAAAEDAFEIFGTKVKRNDDGAFVGTDGTPLAQFLDEGLRLKPYLLAPKDTGGAGSRNGGRQAGAAAFDMNSIKPGMSAADIATATAEIAAALRG